MRAGATAIAATLLVTALLVPTVAAQPTGPSGVHVAYGADPTTDLTVMWTGPPAGTAEVSWEVAREAGTVGGTVTARTEPLPGRERVAYTARLTGLPAGANVSYLARLDDATSGMWNVSLAGPDATSVDVTMFADHGVRADSPLARYDGDSPSRNVELAGSLDSSMHLIAGDLSYANGDPQVWDTYFAEHEAFLATTPTMTVPGNHEREPGQGYAQYDARLKMIDESTRHRWYRFQVGPAMFIGLNSDAICAERDANQVYPIASWSCAGGLDQARRPNPEQKAFVRSSLAAAADDPSIRWTVAFFHNPVFSDGPHGSNEDIQAIWMPLFDRYGLDLVLNGDDHFYSRSHPLTGGEVNATGTTYIVNGAGGAEMYDFEHDSNRSWEAARYNEEYGTVDLDITPDRMRVRYVDLDGTTIDRFEIVHGPDGRPTQMALPSSDAAQGDEPAPGDAPTTPGGLVGTVVVAAAVAALRRR